MGVKLQINFYKGRKRLLTGKTKPASLVSHHKNKMNIMKHIDGAKKYKYLAGRFLTWIVY